MNKIYFKYYVNSTFKNKANLIILNILILIGLIVNSIIPTKELQNYTFIFILPSIAWMILSPMIFSVKFYSVSKTNGEELALASKAIKRSAVVLLRTMSILISTFILNLLLISIIFLPALIRLGNFKMFSILWIIIFFASILIIAFFIALFSVVNSLLPFMPALIISILISVIFSLGSMATRAMINREGHNTLEWNNSNVNNYAKMLKVDSNANIMSEMHVLKKNKYGVNNKIEGDDSINNVNPLISWLNPGEWVVNPISSMFGSAFNYDKNQYTKASQDSYKFSLIKIKNTINPDTNRVKSLNKNEQWIFISEQDFNPFEHNKQEIVGRLKKISDSFQQNFNNNLFKGEQFSMWIDRMESDKHWKNLNLSQEEKEVIKFWAGLKKETHLNMYLSKYGDILKNKTNNLKKLLEDQKFPKEHIKAFDFFLNNQNAKNNIWNSGVIVKPNGLKKEFPFMSFKEDKKKANIFDIEKMENLIHYNYNSNKFRVNLEDDSWVDIDLQSVSNSFKNINTDKEWVDYIKNNNELGSLEKIYRDLKIFLMNNRIKLKIINFSDNAYDSYAMDGIQNFKTVPFANTFGLTSLMLFIATILLFVALNKTYKNKNIS